MTDPGKIPAGPGAIRGIVLGALLGAALCGGWLAAAPPAAAAPARAEGINAVASIAPVHSLLARVMEGAGRPLLLVAGGRSPHSYVLKPSDARALATARAVFWIGPEMEGFLVKPLAALGRNVTAVELLRAEGVKARPFGAGGARGSVGGGASDPHLWLDPRNAAAMARIMVIVMANADPENAVIYRRNGAGLLAELAVLDEEIMQALGPVAGVPYLVFHDAYGYFEERYGLAVPGAVTAVTTGADRPPGARRLSMLRRRIQDSKIACLFTENEFTPALAKTLIEGTAARIEVLDPLGAGLDPGPGLYSGLMRGMARSLVGCLGG